MIFRAAETCVAYRISPTDTNKMVLLFDPEGDGANFVCIIEIFDHAGRTPPNKHDIGQEMFFVLEGEGVARSPAGSQLMRKGDSLLLKPGTLHEIENTGSGKLYCLTFMTPNDGFAELIRKGACTAIEPDEWDIIRGFVAP